MPVKHGFNQPIIKLISRDAGMGCITVPPWPLKGD